jgi:hypothetical protein
MNSGSDEVEILNFATGFLLKEHVQQWKQHRELPRTDRHLVQGF